MPVKKWSFLSGFSFEFWPTGLLYLPVFLSLPYWLLRYRSLSVGSLANPGLYMGGLVNENKYKILNSIPARFKPKTLAFEATAAAEEVLEEITKQKFSFPLIIKPQMGERGNGVEKLEQAQALRSYLQCHHLPFIVQEFINWPEEFGVLWYHIPGGKFGISSLVQKSFLSVIGNGSDTLQTLIERESRAQNRMPYLLEKHQSQLQLVPALGEKVLLEPIGNHCRGTQFLNANAFITPALTAAIAEIASAVPGFYIGRFDIKTTGLDDLLMGKNIQVMELNGITSEPAHIYHPGRGALKGWRDLWNHWNLVFTIGAINRTKGLKPIGTINLLKKIGEAEEMHYDI